MGKKVCLNQEVYELDLVPSIVDLVTMYYDDNGPIT
jgi:hypothetical protein